MWCIAKCFVGCVLALALVVGAFHFFCPAAKKCGACCPVKKCVCCPDCKCEDCKCVADKKCCDGCKCVKCCK